MVEKKIFETDEEMGRAAAADAGEILREWTAEKKLRVIVSFAAAPSQDTFLAHLCKEEGIDWGKVIATHLDEYLDLERGHPNTFEAYLQEHLFNNIAIPQENIHYIKALGGSAQEIAARYGKFMEKTVEEVKKEGGIYIACIGIGVNGHIAFNEPYAGKITSGWVIPVRIDEVSAKQQYDDYKGHPNPKARYKNLKDVPRNAVTISSAGILNADKIFCIVPGRQKAQAVKDMWDGPVTDEMPASLLKTHKCLTLYLDRNSAGML